MKRKLHLVKTSATGTVDNEKNWPVGDWCISSSSIPETSEGNSLVPLPFLFHLVVKCLTLLFKRTIIIVEI